MKKTRYTFIIIATAILASLASCTLETSDAGDYDGFWHLTRMDTIATGGVNDMSKEKIFWSFQNKLMEADDKSGAHQSILMRYEQTKTQLTLNTPYAYDRDNGDKLLADSTLLLPYGINKTEEKFDVVTLKGGKMVLQSEKLKLTFKRF